MQPARSIKRQSALHMFASEYGESTLSEKGSGEFDPSFVVTKIGSRVNRVIVAGLLERIEGRDMEIQGKNISEEILEEMIEDRKKYFSKANIRIPTDNLTPDKTLETILKVLKNV